MTILYNGVLGARKYRVLIFIVDNEFWLFRPYVGYVKLKGDFSWVT